MKKYLYLLVFSLGLSHLYAAPTPARAGHELIQDFSGGLNTTIPSHKLPTNYSPYLRNVFVDNGKIERINGFVTVGSTNTLVKVTGIFPFVRENGQTTFLVTDSSVTVETADFRNWVFVSSGSNSGALLYWMQVRNKMWGFNGVDFVLTWDGVTKTILNGSGTTPNVPKFRFGAYYQDRVFGFGIPSGSSDLYFSATITTDSVIIAPDDYRAWPAINATYVGRGDGQIGTALWIYQGLLRAGKEQSIYTIYGDDPSSYNPRKEEANIGVVSQESVRILDGESILLGQTGVYRNALRISDLIENEIPAINKGISDLVNTSWDTYADFQPGTFFGSTGTPEGILTTNSTTYGGVTLEIPLPSAPRYIRASEISGLANDAFSFTPSTTYYGFYPMVFKSSPLPAASQLYVNQISVQWQDDVLPCRFSSITVKNMKTGEYQLSTGVFDGSSRFLAPFSNAQPIFNGFDLGLSSLALKIEGCGFSLTSPVFNILFQFKDSTTGQYISPVSTLSMVTAWGNFESNNNTNGGNINYYYRTSTSSVNISSQPWQPIVPGAILNAPIINKYLQWSSTMFGVVPGQLPQIDNVTISHIEGQATDARAFAMDWQNRYWLTVTTTSDYTKRLTYVKSKNSNSTADAWMPIEGLPIDCYAKAGNILYGGSVSSGVVYRLDYGTNFDGTAITSIYDTPDLSLGSYFFDKYIFKYLIDGEKSMNGNMTVKSSINERSFTSSTFSITGSGRYGHIVEGVTGTVRTLRLRLQNGEKDIGLGINNVDILYEPRESLSNQ